ncbi:hypothetical protein SAMN04487906_1626 [Zhouia amylolytica]|uniref:Cytokinin riboside 5'-monophosphate phosphoribohydrolase n=1 Tax=Zhouia amylolytica TaxID=376730 RepID=A0A1I6SHZ5_9FLAO|nr:TIGR00730 family Rossman fold protein [Zhouia amylolytica]MCQ0111632.1 TIGR00730 family Rossman fold protein [Zhouia amylolytica]SFS76591.1 hypothetical protein SAMN04487906_1626 [Zhouia amylolytica]
MQSIAVFCASSNGCDSDFEKIAYSVGVKLANQKIKIVYGGSNVGLMGAVADGALNGAGEVTGVLPTFLQEKEIAHDGLTELILVDSMHERKIKIFEMSEGSLTLPGGFGTMDELFEMLTWAQLGMHHKPIGVLNIKGYYDPLIQLVDSMTKNGLLKQENRNMILFEDDLDRLLQRMEHYAAPKVGKWITTNRI